MGLSGNYIDSGHGPRRGCDNCGGDHDGSVCPFAASQPPSGDALREALADLVDLIDNTVGYDGYYRGLMEPALATARAALAALATPAPLDVEPFLRWAQVMLNTDDLRVVQKAARAYAEQEGGA